MIHSFEINPRPLSVGGGWKMQLFEDGLEVGGGVFPAGDDGYCDAFNTASEWVADYEVSND